MDREELLEIGYAKIRNADYVSALELFEELILGEENKIDAENAIFLYKACQGAMICLLNVPSNFPAY